MLFGRSFAPHCVSSTRSGVLIMTCEKTASVYLIDPETGRTDRLAGAGSAGPPIDGDGSKAQFRSLFGLVVSEREQCAYVSDTYHNLIRRITLPPHLFVARHPPTHSELFIQLNGPTL
jgi:hypothetical protein